MAKVITFSRVFPAYHPKAGEQTYFVEKIWESMWSDTSIGEPYLDNLPVEYLNFRRHTYPAKKHTIRLGERWHIGEKFSPRVWSGKPYASKQIAFASDIEILKIWDFEIKNGLLYIDGKGIMNEVFMLAANDGLDAPDLLQWLKHPKPFSGQIICWSDDVQY